VSATVCIYNAIKADLLPTPSKSHYSYNLRDVSKVMGHKTQQAAVSSGFKQRLQCSCLCAGRWYEAWGSSKVAPRAN
jgi:hypothetical protein